MRIRSEESSASRPRGESERRLIRAAREILPRTGIAGLKVRQVAARAGVNLGVFHYHFRSRSEFCRRVLAEIYEEPFRRFDAVVVAPAGRSPLQRLRHMMEAMARFARENRALGLALLRDVLNEDPDAIGFMQWHLPRHMQHVGSLVAECQRAGLIRKMPVPVAMSILGATVMAPSMETAIFERLGAGRAAAPVMRHLLLTDRRLDERVELALRALAPDRGHAGTRA
ncbi:MAG: TetR/AcrR family transcriptional regulator [Candidatus Coatesbacteria bacterium]